VSYTIETLAELRRERSGRPLCLILGMDAFAGLEGWHRWREIIGLAHLAVAKRPGSALTPSGPIQGLLDRHGVPDPSELHRREAGCLLIRDVPALDISASAIRARIAAGRSPRHLLPDAVLELIERNRLYRKTAT
jgi:nicotinate-nucleotide adenylyltransferase